MKRILTVYEHQHIRIGQHFDADKIMISHSQAAQIGKLEATLAKPIFRWGYQQLTAQQWVGHLEIPGLQIEILPKMDKLSTDSDAKIRNNLLYMLLKATDIPYRESDLAALATQSSSILECYITVFTDKLTLALKSGLIHQYVPLENNERFLKGKLLIPEHIQKNRLHKERFYIQYDEFSSENILNRILKATLVKLLNLTKSNENAKKLRTLNAHFADINESKFRITDFQNVKVTRLHRKYQGILEMAKVFWQNDMPVQVSGEIKAFSLLFDMNKVYEGFLRYFLQKYECEIFGENHVVLRQRKQKYLFKDREHRGEFSLIPDILVQNQQDHSIQTIIDMKWKHLQSNDKKLGISQADMYQMYGYAREFQCKQVVLLYPEFRTSESGLPLFYNDTIDGRLLLVKVCTIGLHERLPEGERVLVSHLQTQLHHSENKPPA